MPHRFPPAKRDLWGRVGLAVGEHSCCCLVFLFLYYLYANIGSGGGAKKKKKSKPATPPPPQVPHSLCFKKHGAGAGAAALHPRASRQLLEEMRLLCDSSPPTGSSLGSSRPLAVIWAHCCRRTGCGPHTLPESARYFFFLSQSFLTLFGSSRPLLFPSVHSHVFEVWL